MVFESQIQELVRQRDIVQKGLAGNPEITVFPSEANFVLFRVERAAAVWRDLLHSYSILVRDLSRVPGCEECLRVSIGSDADNKAFLLAMDELMRARRENDMFATANGDEYDTAVGTSGPID